MVTINDKISALIDIDTLLNIGSREVSDVINGDSYRINIVYKNMLDIFRSSPHTKFIHILTGKTMSLSDWMSWYQTDSKDEKSIVIFLRFAVHALNITF